MFVGQQCQQDTTLILVTFRDQGHPRSRRLDISQEQCHYRGQQSQSYVNSVNVTYPPGAQSRATVNKCFSRIAVHDLVTF